ncbi:hypothetical protein TIFTF001_009483 [Ficus carica]|uniref:Uncharacterized protein n=1 Tax=Ficus carica TaxID=3494 RepID=A0AA88AH57_FICCA|nr:hypothetical protein TIFTF001_009483 [Ficus carica]
MLKQSPSRSQRPKGFKVKHVLHLCVLLAVCIWLLYQVNHSRDKKAAYEEDSPLEISQKMQNGRDEIIKLGRRDLHPLVKGSLFDIEKRQGKEEGSEEEMEGSRSEESYQVDGQGGGDDEIDGHDQEMAEGEESEGMEDLIDEEDREREEGSEEQEGDEDKGFDFDDVLEDQIQDEEEGKGEIQEAIEERYKEDDASGSVTQNIQTISGSLRKIQEKEVESKNTVEVRQETKTYYTEDFSVGMEDSGTKGHLNLRARSSGSENASGVQVGNKIDSSSSDDAFYSTSLVEANEQSKMKNDLAMLLVKVPTLNGTSKLRELIHDLNSDLTLSVVDNLDAAQKEMEVLNGSWSISSQGTLQFDATDGTEKSTNENAVSRGESKTDDGLHSGERSSKILTADDNLDAAEEQAGEEEKSEDSSDFTFYQEDRLGANDIDAGV